MYYIRTYSIKFPTQDRAYLKDQNIENIQKDDHHFIYLSILIIDKQKARKRKTCGFRLLAP